MAGEINGADVILAMSMSDSAAEDYEVLGSQRGVTFNTQTNTIDTSSKQTGRRGTFLTGRQSETVQLDKLFVPSEAAYEALVAANRAGDTIRIMRLMRPTPDGDYENIESADAVITGLSESFPDQEASTCSITLQVSGDWTAA